MSSAGNLREIMPYHVVGDDQEVCKFHVHIHHPDMCRMCASYVPDMCCICSVSVSPVL